MANEKNTQISEEKELSNIALKIKKTPVNEPVEEEEDLYDDDVTGWVEIIDYIIKPKSIKYLKLANGESLRCTRLCEFFSINYFSKIIRYDTETGEPIYGEPNNIKIAQGITKHYDIITVEGAMYVYLNGCYKPNIARNIIIKEANNILGTMSGSKKLHEIEKYIRDATIYPIELVDVDFSYVNVKNGIYHFESGKLLPHSPEYMCTVQLDVEYNPDATCPVINDYLNFAIEEKYHKSLLQAASLILIPYTHAQHITIFAGAGGEGKTQFLHALRKLIEGHYSTVSLGDLAKDQFASFELYRSRANICGDIESQGIDDMAKIRAITGSETVRGRQLYHNGINFRNTAQMFFSANKIPKLKNVVEADYDRMNIIPYRRKVRGTDMEDSRFENKITAPEELSGFLNLLIKHLGEYLKQGRIYYPLTREELIELYDGNSDTLSMFHEDCVVNVEGLKMSRLHVYDIYSAYSKYYVTSAINKRAFGNSMKNHGFSGLKGRDIKTSTWENIDVKLPKKILNFFVESGEFEQNSARYNYLSGGTYERFVGCEIPIQAFGESPELPQIFA